MTYLRLYHQPSTAPAMAPITADASMSTHAAVKSEIFICAYIIRSTENENKNITIAPDNAPALTDDVPDLLNTYDKRKPTPKFPEIIAHQGHSA